MSDNQTEWEKDKAIIAAEKGDSKPTTEELVERMRVRLQPCYCESGVLIGHVPMRCAVCRDRQALDQILAHDKSLREDLSLAKADAAAGHELNATLREALAAKDAALEMACDHSGSPNAALMHERDTYRDHATALAKALGRCLSLVDMMEHEAGWEWPEGDAHKSTLAALPPELREGEEG